MRIGVSTIVALLLVTWMSNTASAQIKGISEGDRVRVAISPSRGDKIVGKVVSMTLTHLRLNSYSSDILISSITGIEVRRKIPKVLQSSLVGAGIGGIGIGLFALLAFGKQKSCPPNEWFCNDSTPNSEVFFTGFQVGAIPGFVIGAFWGALKREQMWNEIPMDLTAIPVSQYNSNNIDSPGIRLKLTF